MPSRLPNSLLENVGVPVIMLVAAVIWCSVMPSLIRRANTRAQSTMNIGRLTIISFVSLVVIAISKTVLTKYIFEHIHAPVAMSALSCIVTGFMLVPLNLWWGTFRLLSRDEFKALFPVCLAVAADLAFTNIGLSILPIAFQQAMKSTLPMAAVIVECLLYRKCVSKSLFAIIFGICLGPIVMAFDKSWSSDDNILYGLMMMMLSVIAGALKYVLAHSTIIRYKEKMGVIGFTFWIEVFATACILPWSIANGEIKVLIQNSSSWMLLLGTAAFGGVRILAQFFFLEETSATSLAASNIVIQVGLTAAGALVFHNSMTASLICGTLIAIVMSASYTYLKTTVRKHEVIEGLSLIETSHASA
jgi:hypothetical protein